MTERAYTYTCDECTAQIGALEVRVPDGWVEVMITDSSDATNTYYLCPNHVLAAYDPLVGAIEVRRIGMAKGVSWLQKESGVDVPDSVRFAKPEKLSECQDMSRFGPMCTLPLFHQGRHRDSEDFWTMEWETS